MSCSILTAARLEALLAGKLAQADRAAVAEHLKSPCEACLDALGSVDGERILAALAGEKADLTASEADQMFEAAVPIRRGGLMLPANKRVEAQQPSFWEKVIGWLGGATWRPALGVAALLLVAVPVLLLGQRTGPAGAGGYDGIKGGPTAPASALKANLIGVIGGRFNGKPFISRRAAQREQLRPGEVLLVRFRLMSGAAVHLQIAGPKASLGVWPDGRADSEPQPALMPVGEHALVADKQVLAIQTMDYGSPVRVSLVASPKPFPAGFSFAADAKALAAACPDCVLEVLEVLPPPEGVEPDESFR
ncbi:MAG TPA: hypothetical protein VGK67_13305 [Myxococcales bacterium]|jgi:hypothetical protein